MKADFITLRPRHNSYGLFSIAPLGGVYLGTILKEKGYDVTVYDEDRSKIYKKGSPHPKILQADFVGLTVISPTANRALEFLKALRTANPSIRLAVGGPHVLGDEQAAEFARYADVVLQYEAENIIEDVVTGKVNGIVKGSCLDDLNRLPIPDLNLLEYSKKKYLDFFKLTTVSTARGCRGIANSAR